MSFTTFAIRGLKTGSRVKVFAADGIFEGVVHSVDQKRLVLALRNVLNLETGVHQMKLSLFAANTIQRFEVVDDSARTCNKKKSSTSNRLIDMAFKEEVHHLSCLPHIDHDYLANSWTLGTRDESDNSSIIGEKSEESILLISDMSEEFFSSLDDIATQSTIGLAVQGIAIGRNGQLCLLQIATINKTYIYDMLVLGLEGFDNGLRAVLESETVQKVVYNCRCLSDMLCHQYDVLLDNVFDVQVAEVVLFQQRHSSNMPRFVGSLAACCTKYLGLTHEDLFFQRVRQYSKQQDEAIWSSRPVTSQMLDAAYKNVVHLRPLRRVMIEAMLADFVRCVDIFLLAYRCEMNDEYNKLKGSPNSLPQKLVSLLCQKVSRSTKIPCFIHNFDRESNDPWIHLSHDGISHGRVPSRVVSTSIAVSQQSQRVVV